MSTYQKTSLISVDEAITKGRQMLLLPRIVMRTLALQRVGKGIIHEKTP